MNPALEAPEEGMTLDELSNFVGEQLKRANLVLKNIDGLNIVDIKFELQGGAYIQLNRKGLVFFDGTNKTFTVDINGKATLTGVNVQTKNGAYPNITLDGDGDLLKASKSANEYIAINPNMTGKPTLHFKAGTIEGLMSFIDSTLSLITVGGNIAINSQSGDLFLGCNKLRINGSPGYTGRFNTGTETIYVENGIITDVR